MMSLNNDIQSQKPNELAALRLIETVLCDANRNVCPHTTFETFPLSKFRSLDCFCDPILIHISHFLDIQSFARFSATRKSFYTLLSPLYPSKTPYWCRYSNAYGPRDDSWYFRAYPAKYEDCIELDEYDGLETPRVHISYYMEKMIRSVDTNDPSLRAIISKLQRTTYDTVYQELQYFLPWMKMSEPSIFATGVIKEPGQKEKLDMRPISEFP